MTIGKIKVASKRDNLYEELGWVNIVCDRTSLLGNPFDMSKNESLRHAVCMAFREWLWTCHLQTTQNPNSQVQLDKWVNQGLKIAPTFKNPTAGQVMEECEKLLTLLKQGKNVKLLCWCHPAECHLDMLTRYLRHRLDGSISSPIQN